MPHEQVIDLLLFQAKCVSYDEEILRRQMERPTLRPSERDLEEHNPFQPLKQTSAKGRRV